MKRIFKKTGFVMVALALLSVPAWGRGPGNVSRTIHNLSVDQPIAWNQWASNVDEVCVFCHTPHGGLLVGPLWNHSMTGASFTHYNSVTLSQTLQTEFSRPVNNESLLCLACHDGSVAVNHLTNDPNSLGGKEVLFYLDSDNNASIQSLANGMPGARIGAVAGSPGLTGDLSDDHPISFSYDAVYNEYQSDSGNSHYDQLHPSADASLADVRFFGADNNVECSSCHDPHVNHEDYPEYFPFLVRSNKGSALCLACHNK